MDPITEQELLDWNWARFGAHPELTAMDEYGSCCYRTDDPNDPRGWRGCAIGNWMPNEVYQANMEGGTIYFLAVESLKHSEDFAALHQWLRHCRVDFLTALQLAHDRLAGYFSLASEEEEVDAYSQQGARRKFRLDIQTIARRFELVDPTGGSDD